MRHRIDRPSNSEMGDRQGHDVVSLEIGRVGSTRSANAVVPTGTRRRRPERNLVLAVFALVVEHAPDFRRVHVEFQAMLA